MIDRLYRCYCWLGQWHPQLSIVHFTLIASLGNALLFHMPLYTFALEKLYPLSFNGNLILLTLFLVVFISTAVMLLLLFMISRRLTIASSILFSVGNTVALYFITTYQVVLDRTMMGNVLNTNIEEASAFLSAGTLPYVLFLCLPLCFLLARTQIRKSSRSRISVLSLGLIVFAIGLLYLSSSTWLWVDKHAKKLGGMVLPFSYIVNTVRYEAGRIDHSREQIQLPDAHFLADQKTIVVLVIGESARANNFSLYGYERNTNPLLSHTGAIALKNTTACSTYTTASLRCILSHLDMSFEFAKPYETLPTYLYRHGVDVIWRTNNWGEPPMKVAEYQRARDLRATCTGPDCSYDPVLLTRLVERIRTSEKNKVLVVLHQRGSHGPTYHTEYPDRFERFSPVCNSVEANNCKPSTLTNAYDNTILYTDFVLNRVVNLLETLEDTSTLMMYISDHGESLGEFGLFLHGTPYSLAPDVQKLVPFIVWMSEKFKCEKGVTNEQLLGQTKHSQLNVFHSMMGAFDMRSPVYNASEDIFSCTLGEASQLKNSCSVVR